MYGTEYGKGSPRSRSRGEKLCEREKRETKEQMHYIKTRDPRRRERTAPRGARRRTAEQGTGPRGRESPPHTDRDSTLYRVRQRYIKANQKGRRAALCSTLCEPQLCPGT